VIVVFNIILYRYKALTVVFYEIITATSTAKFSVTCTSDVNTEVCLGRRTDSGRPCVQHISCEAFMTNRFQIQISLWKFYWMLYTLSKDILQTAQQISPKVLQKQ